MKDLFIGSSSQLAHYWPKENTVFISSRIIDIDWIKTQYWNKIIIGFSDGRTWIKGESKEDYDSFCNLNLDFTLNLINQVKSYCNTVLFYSTTELWNLTNGPITLETPFEYYATPYIVSKAIITKTLLKEKEKYKNVIVLFPFPFNSPIRKEKTYLFSKVFSSIIENKKIKIGNTSYYRDLLHPRFVVKESIKANKHQIIGSGRMVFVKDFIECLYLHFSLDPNYFIVESKEEGYKTKQNIFYLNSKECLYSYEQLIEDTVYDLRVILER